MQQTLWALWEISRWFQTDCLSRGSRPLECFHHSLKPKWKQFWNIYSPCWYSSGWIWDSFIFVILSWQLVLQSSLKIPRLKPPFKKLIAISNQHKSALLEIFLLIIWAKFLLHKHILHILRAQSYYNLLLIVPVCRKKGLGLWTLWWRKEEQQWTETPPNCGHKTGAGTGTSWLVPTLQAGSPYQAPAQTTVGLQPSYLFVVPMPQGAAS